MIEMTKETALMVNQKIKELLESSDYVLLYPESKDSPNWVILSPCGRAKACQAVSCASVSLLLGTSIDL